MKKLLFSLLILFPSWCFGQLTDGVNDPYNNWNGVSHWTDYMTVSTGKFGPNALPVPRLENGLLDSLLIVNVGALYHHNPEDKTPSINYSLYIPVGKKASIEFRGTFIEMFNMSERLRYERRTYRLRGEGEAFGDIWVHSNYQLIKEHSKLPDLAAHVGLKTALGNELQTARYTDTPGYMFYLSSGKNIDLPTLNANLRLYGHVGFFAWQTYSYLHRQDDATMYGFGVQLNVGEFLFSHELTGFHGYRDLGDRPMVYRLRIGREKNNRITFMYQNGIHDYDYHSFAINYFFIKRK